MSGYLVDTTVISETMRSVPDGRVVTFLAEHDDLWLSSIVVHELEFGVRRLPTGRQRSGLEADLLRLTSEYEDRILPLDRMGAEWAARFRVLAQSAGHTLDFGDALIAGTAKAHDLAVATRNVTDFQGVDVELVNPWDAR
jgi:predicted nucleic acid-binding protein